MPTLHDSSTPVHVVVTTTATGVTVSVNGTQVLSWTGTVPASAYLAFTGGDGGRTDLHAVENVTITTGEPPAVRACCRFRAPRCRSAT